MTSSLVSPVIPAIALPHRDQQRSTSDARAARRRRHLPVPDVPLPRTNATVYGMTTLDCRGRVANQAALRALGWTAGRRLQIRETHGLVIIHADPHGVFQVTSRGHLRLPANVRHCCGLATGERVLLAADPTQKQLVIYPPAALDTIIAERHTRLQGGETT